MPEFNLTPTVIIIPILIAFALIELGISRLMGRSVHEFQDSITSVNIGILSQFVNATGAVVSVFMYASIQAGYGTFTWDMANPLTWIFALVFYDFLYYWVHRTGHEVNMFWVSHATHHSSEEFNLSTALRQASTAFYFKWVFYMPLAILGIPVKVFIIVTLVDILYQFFVHTRLVGRLGVLELFLVTPSNHRVHHGKNDYCIDKNYGGIFCVWDRLFNTYADEREDEPVDYGLKTRVNSWNPVWINLYFWVMMFRKAAAQTNWRDKLMCFFGEPSWLPEQSSKPQNKVAPAEDKLKSSVSLEVRLSGLVMTLLSASLLVLYLGSKQQMTAVIQIAIVTIALLTFAIVGLLWTTAARIGEES
ncbi:MAG: alkylglycerol monooxygenase [Enterobacterales bacterium]|jgi:alkylglycerol monooxygenase